MKKKKFGFTLAEVLVTLMIIGVIASMTIPGLKKNADEQQYIAGMKKAYSVLSQAVSMSENDNGSLKRWPLNAQTIAKEYLIPYLNVAKDCGTTATPACYGTPASYLSSSTVYNPATYFIVLADGTKMSIECQPEHCHIAMDVNGEKKPNKYGIDTFYFTLQLAAPFVDYAHVADTPGVYHFGQGTSRAALLSDCKNRGLTCGALIVLDGDKMKY